VQKLVLTATTVTATDVFTACCLTQSYFLNLFTCSTKIIYCMLSSGQFPGVWIIQNHLVTTRKQKREVLLLVNH